MKHSIGIYKTIAIFCFLILASVQFFLVRNTYELTKDRFYFAEKTALKESYSRSIKNDKIFPGSSAILDSFLSRNIDSLNSLYHTEPSLFHAYKQVIADSIFHELQKNDPIKRFISRFRKEKNITDSLQYALIVESLSAEFKNDTFVPVYDKNEIYSLIAISNSNKSGVRIGGNLKNISDENKVNGFSINGVQKFPYKINFSLHVEPRNMNNAILKEMILTFSLSLASILIVVILFFVTFRNWAKQTKLSELKSDFINNITHELNTPLAAIIVANKNLQNERILEKKENIRPLTEVIQRQSDRLKILIGEVLDIASTGKIKLDKKNYSVNELLDQILLDYRLKLAGTGINVEFHKETINDVVPLDKFRFTTMLLNLFDNAIKYNANELKEVSITTMRDKDNNLQILIKDNGMGIKSENIRRIFDKFYRGSESVLPNAKGLGLGLFYVKQIVDAHYWNISVKSTLGEGTLFIITIPYQNRNI